MSGMNPSEQDVQDWVQNLTSTEGVLKELGTNFQYLIDNLEEYENGEIGIEDLPKGDEADKLITLTAVSIGTIIQATNSNIYKVRENGNFVGFATKEETAENIVENKENYSINTISIETDPDTIGPHELIEDIEELNPIIADMFRKSYSWAIDVVDSETSVDTSYDSTTEGIIKYGMLFGILWESEVPSIHIIFNETGIVRAVYKSEIDYEGDCDIMYLRDMIEEENNRLLE